MSHHQPQHDSSAFGMPACAGAAWLGSGAAIGLIVMDSNRPAIGAGAARELLKQFVAAH